MALPPQPTKEGGQRSGGATMAVGSEILQSLLKQVGAV